MFDTLEHRQLYDLGDPWGHSGTGDGNGRNLADNETVCCKGFQNCQHPPKNWTCTAAQNASNLACLAKGHKLKACSDSNFCANPDPSTGKLGPSCLAWNASLWSTQGLGLTFCDEIHVRMLYLAARTHNHAAVCL